MLGSKSHWVSGVCWGDERACPEPRACLAGIRPAHRTVRQGCEGVVKEGKTVGQRRSKRQTWAQKSALGASLAFDLFVHQ